MSEIWHGWRRGFVSPEAVEESLHIGELPGRKSIVMYVMRGSVIKPLAYFRDVDSATDAMETFDRIMGLTKEAPHE